MRAAIYCRYSSDMQSDASIEDQVRLCKARIKREGWSLGATYSDRAISGAQVLRPGYQKLLHDVREGHIDVVVAEALDRISRDQEHVAAFFKQLKFADVKLVTISEGEVNELHVGMKGTMNALFLKDLAAKTHRGLEGRVRAGKSAGGRAFGYSIVRQFGDDGQPVAGLRSVNQEEVATIRRVFKMFASGTSPRAIAKVLNDEQILGPDGRRWSESTIRGHASRRTGLLRNELYRGKLVWNKQRYIKDPHTGKRLARINPVAEWIWHDAPEMRIVTDALWSAVQARLDGISQSPRVQKARAKKFWEHRRPKHLLTGIATCGKCDGPLSSIGGDYMACSASRRCGTCDNKSSIRRSTLEDAVLGALKDNLLQPELVAEFVRTYHTEVNRVAAEAEASRTSVDRRLAKIKKQIDALLDSFAEGLRSQSMKDRLEALEAEKVNLEQLTKQPAPTPLRLHPRLPELYRAKVEKLAKSLSDPDIRDEATTLLRELIDTVSVSPMKNGWEVKIKGEVGRMVNLAEGKTEQNQCSVKVVAGACNPRQFALSPIDI